MCKKLVSVLLCGLLVLTFFTPASAGLIQDQSGVRQYPILVDQGENYQVVSIPLTEKEAEKRYAEFEALNFSIGVSTSGTYYARKLMSISKTKTF